MNPAQRDPIGISGTVLNEKYLVGDVIGEGGFCVVYRAEHRIWKQPVALKVFKILGNAPAEHRGRLLESFIQEGRLMAALSSRSAAIVQARDIDTFTTPDGQWLPYMVLEWLDGKPLDLVMHEERMRGLPPRQIHEVLALLEPAAIAFELAHRQNVAHRDVKPANIFVLGDPRGIAVHVKVLDFGIAKVMAEHAEAAVAMAHTGKDITAFTPNYGAPEQFSRQYGATGPWTDVFSMALILVELLRGGLPALDGNDFMQLAFSSRDPQRRPTPRTLGVEVSSEVEAVFAKALAVNVADRFRTMGEMWSALHHSVFPDATTWSLGTSASPGRAVSMMGLGTSVPETAKSATGDPRISATPMPAGLSSHPPGSSGMLTGATGATGGPLISATNPAQAGQSMPPSNARSGRALLGFGLFSLAALGVGAFVALRVFGPPSTTTPPAGPASAAPIVVSPASAKPSASAADKPPCPGDMVLVPGGRFFMGTDSTSPALALARPSHKVAIDTFCIDAFEVTAEDYKSCSDQGDCKRPETKPVYPKGDKETQAEHDKKVEVLAELCNFGKPDRDKHPINCVSWTLSSAYCNARGKRLPTEAEWEFAARGSDGRKFPWGDDPGDHTFMNACGAECNKWEGGHTLPLTNTMFPGDDGFFGTAPVGSFPKGKTKYGAFDVVGNVWEWTSDFFATYTPDEAINPKGPPVGDRHAIRGGAFNGGVPEWLDPAFRYHQVTEASVAAIGFRCARSL